MRTNNKQRRLNRRLIPAAITGNLRALNKLLKAGADPRAWNNAPIAYALSCKNPHIVKRLLKTSPFTRDHLVMHPWCEEARSVSQHSYKRLFDAKKDNRAEKRYWELIAAVKAGRQFKFNRLIQSTNIWARDQMALRIAVEYGRYSMVKAFLKLGMNPYDEPFGRARLPTFHFAIIYRRPLIARRLLDQRDHYRKEGPHREQYIQNALSILGNNPESETFFIALCREAGSMPTKEHSELLHTVGKPGIPVSMLEAVLPLGDGECYVNENVVNLECFEESFGAPEDVLVSLKKLLDSREGDPELKRIGQEALGHIIDLRNLLAQSDDRLPGLFETESQPYKANA